MAEQQSYRERQLALATEERGYVREDPPPSRQRSIVDWSHPDQEDLVASLVEHIVEESWPVATLREQIDKLGVEPYGRSRQRLATQLAENFLNPDRLREVIEQLPESVREFYAQLLFNLRLSYPRNAQEGWLFVKTPELSLEHNHEIIISMGLGLEIEQAFVVPAELYPMLPSLYLPLPSFFYRDVSAGDISAANPLRLVGQIQQLLGLVRAETPELRRRLRWQSGRGYARSSEIVPTPETALQFQEWAPGEELRVELMAPEPPLPDATLERWAAALDDTPERVEFLYQLLVTLGVLRAGSPVEVEPENAEQFIALAPGRQIYELLDAYLSTDWRAFASRWRQGDVRVEWLNQYYRGFWGLDEIWSQMTNFFSGLIIDLLEFAPHDQWLSLEQMQGLLLKITPDLTRRFHDRRLSFRTPEGDFEAFLQLYLLEILRGPLHALGLVDLARDAQQRIFAFRLHGFQELMWRRSYALPTPEVEATGTTLRWRGDDELLLSPPVPIPFLRQVQRWARPRGATAGALRYQLDPRRLHAAFEEGETPETLAAAWVEQGEQPPERLRAWWKRWWSRYGHLRLYPAQAVLEVADEFALHELHVAVPEIQEALTGMVTPRVALLRREAVPAVIVKMEAKGYMPKVVEQNATEERG